MIDPGTDVASVRPPDTDDRDDTDDTDDVDDTNDVDPADPVVLDEAATTPETVRRLRAEVEALRAELARRDEALATLGERLLPVEQARLAGAEEERAARLAAEEELRRLQATKLYRLLLRPRAALWNFRERRGTV